MSATGWPVVSPVIGWPSVRLIMQPDKVLGARAESFNGFENKILQTGSIQWLGTSNTTRFIERGDKYHGRAGLKINRGIGKDNVGIV